MTLLNSVPDPTPLAVWYVSQSGRARTSLFAILHYLLTYLLIHSRLRIQDIEKQSPRLTNEVPLKGRATRISLRCNSASTA